MKSIVPRLPHALERLQPALLALALLATSVVSAQAAQASTATSASNGSPSAATTATAIAERFVSAINAADGGALNALIDSDALAAQVIGNLDATDRTHYQEVLAAQYAMLGYSVAAQMAVQNATATVLPSSPSASNGDFLVRITTRDARGNHGHGYLQVQLGQNGRIIDWYDHSLAQSMSGQLAFSTAGMLSRLQIAQLLFGKVGDAAATTAGMQKFAAMVSAGNLAGAHAALLTMPQAVAERREFATLKVTMARHVSIDAYREAMAELAQRHGDADELQFILIDHYLLSGQPERALRAIDRAARLIGDDEVMDANRCHALLDLERKADALAACDRAIARNPSFDTPRWTRVRLALKTEDAALAIESLSGVEQAQGSKLDAGKLAKNKVYTWLVKQPEFATWGAQRGWAAPDGERAD